jgi:hypothetical protein
MSAAERTLTRHSFPSVNDPRVAGAICPDHDPFVAYKDVPRNKEGLLAAAKDSFSTTHVPPLKKLQEA